MDAEPNSVARWSYGSVFRLSPVLRNLIIDDAWVGRREVLLIDADHVAVPAARSLEPRQPDLCYTEWLVRVSPSPAAEPDVRDSFRQDEVIDLLRWLAFIRAREPVEVVVDVVTSAKQEEVSS